MRAVLEAEEGKHHGRPRDEVHQRAAVRGDHEPRPRPRSELAPPLLVEARSKLRSEVERDERKRGGEDEERAVAKDDGEAEGMNVARPDADAEDRAVVIEAHDAVAARAAVHHARRARTLADCALPPRPAHAARARERAAWVRLRIGARCSTALALLRRFRWGEKQLWEIALPRRLVVPARHDAWVAA